MLEATATEAQSAMVRPAKKASMAALAEIPGLRTQCMKSTRFQ